LFDEFFFSLFINIIMVTNNLEIDFLVQYFNFFRGKSDVFSDCFHEWINTKAPCFLQMIGSTCPFQVSYLF